MTVSTPAESLLKGVDDRLLGSWIGLLDLFRGGTDHVTEAWYSTLSALLVNRGHPLQLAIGLPPPCHRSYVDLRTCGLTFGAKLEEIEQIMHRFEGKTSCRPVCSGHSSQLEHEGGFRRFKHLRRKVDHRKSEENLIASESRVSQERIELSDGIREAGERRG